MIGTDFFKLVQDIADKNYDTIFTNISKELYTCCTAFHMGQYKERVDILRGQSKHELIFASQYYESYHTVTHPSTHHIGPHLAYQHIFKFVMLEKSTNQ